MRQADGDGHTAASRGGVRLRQRDLRTRGFDRVVGAAAGRFADFRNGVRAGEDAMRCAEAAREFELAGSTSTATIGSAPAATAPSSSGEADAAMPKIATLWPGRRVRFDDGADAGHDERSRTARQSRAGRSLSTFTAERAETTV